MNKSVVYNGVPYCIKECFEKKKKKRVNILFEIKYNLGIA